MRRLRDVFYVNAYPDENKIIYYGMELIEFLKYSPVELNQLLLLESEYYGADTKSKTNFEIIGKNEMEDFLGENTTNYGDFCWVDFDSRENVEKLEPIEIAELLYLGHMMKPLKTPFFDKIQNRYAYLAHDDGWLCQLYCRYYSDFGEIIANKVINMVSTSKRKKIYPLSEDLKNMLLDLAQKGLMIDFSGILKNHDGSIEIPIYCIGKKIDMDDMYNNLNRYISRAKYSARLIHKSKKWAIEDETIK